MFKKSLGERLKRVTDGEAHRNLRGGHHHNNQQIAGGLAGRLALGCLAFLSAILLVSCSTLVGKLPPADLKEPGWTVREGQAVWHIPTGNREIAGDVMVATRPDGSSFVQFSKSPFAIVIAQENSNQWQVEFPPQNRHYAGRGKPPKRIIWLYLPKVLAGQVTPTGWTWHEDASGWRLVNNANGESLEGFFNS